MHKPMVVNNAKPKEIGKTLKRLATYLRPHLGYIILALILSVVSATSMILGPYFLGNITKYTQEIYALKMAGATVEMLDAVMKKISNTGVLLIVIYALGASGSYLCGFFMTGATQKVANKMRSDISLKINKLPLSYFDTRSFGDVLSRVTNDIDTVSQNMNQALSQMLSAITLFIGVFVAMLVLSPSMTLIPVITIPLSMILMIIVVKFSQKYFRAQQKDLGLINGHIEEAYSGQMVIKAFNQEEKEAEIFDQLNKNLKTSAWKSQFLSGLMQPLMMLIGNLSYIAICAFGGIFIVTGVLGVEMIQTFIQYTRLLNQPTQQIGQIANVLQLCTASSERVFEFLSETEMTLDNPQTVLPKEKVSGEVIFKNVDFGYTPERQIIFNFNTVAKPGQKIAIVGPTGAGKTTLVNLLMRFYEVNSGEIRIDGIRTTDLTRENVTSLFGMVLQDTWLFEGTLRDNLTYGNHMASDEEIWRALKACHMDHFVNSLPGKLDYILDENANVSAGQKQLLTIARTMIENAPMLILDEATSSVDTRTEILIQQAMDKLMEGRTSFVIAHRLSTIKNADLILVLKDGNVVEQGNHENLLAHNGFYASLYNSQFSE